MKFKEHNLAHRWCRGTGLEIGAAAHNPFGLNARNVATYDPFYEKAQIELCGEAAPIDVEAYADRIPLEDASQDFILSSHVVEHLPDLIGALVEWNRLLKSGGICFIIHPLRYALSGDESRPLTPLEHYIDDYGNRYDRNTHPLQGVTGGAGGHYHVAEIENLIEVVDFTNSRDLTDWELVDLERVDTKVGNGFTLVFRKQEHSRQP